ncbi:Lds1p PWA37_002236 [Arxiozyma heterogenica]|uniref:Lds1p n=1 Tax=Arxiozyma heterogenica TaxID=278026 RepID=UPI002EE2C8DE
MCFTITFILTAINGLFYKYDRSQKFLVLPDSSTDKNELKDKTYKNEISKINTRVINIISNFSKSFFQDSPWLYPFKGISNFLQFKEKYLRTVLGRFFLYLCNFSFILVLYWLTITPIYLTMFLILGPFGVWLVLFHSILHANCLTMLSSRLMYPNASLIFKCLRVHNYTKVKIGNIATIRYYVPITTKYFWVYYLPKKIIKYLFYFTIFLFQIFLSFIPIVGPFLFHLTMAPYIGRIYLTKILRLQKLNNLQRKEYFYTYLGMFASFGVTAGLLETIPLLSGICLSTNYIATSLWLMDNEK